MIFLKNIGLTQFGEQKKEYADFAQKYLWLKFPDCLTFIVYNHEQ